MHHIQASGRRSEVEMLKHLKIHQQSEITVPQFMVLATKENNEKTNSDTGKIRS